MSDRSYPRTRLLHLCSRLALTVLFAGNIFSGPLSAANPSNKDFDAGLDVHGKAYASSLAKHAQGLYEASNTEINNFVKAIKTNKVNRLGVKPLGVNDVRLQQLRRTGIRLELLRETAGVDYRLRAESLLRTSGDIIDTFRGTPVAQKQLDQVRVQLARNEPARARELEKIIQLVKQGKWEAAETALYKLFDQLGVATACLPNQEQNAIYAPFSEVQTAIDATMRKARTAKANSLLQERRQNETPNFAGILQEAQAAAASLASSGTVAIDGEAATGPEAITKFGARWAEAQVKAIRCRTLDWLIKSSQGGFEGNPTTGTTVSPMDAEYARFNMLMMQSLAALIEADAGRVSGPAAVKLYEEYLQACAPLIRRSANLQLATALNPALVKLAGRAPQFAAEVTAYAEGTGDLLRWRNRVARQKALARAAEYPSLDSLMLAATSSDETYTGLYPQVSPRPEEATLMASAPEVMPRPIEKLQGQRAHALDVVRLGNSGPVAIARYRVRSYANIPAPLDLAGETEALKFDLMVTESSPAITMLAAVAIDSAERGDLAAVGGTITNQYLESLTTRFGSLPTAASVLTALGAFPESTNLQNVQLREQMLMRFDLTASWAQHDYFFVEFSPAAAAAE